MVSSILLLLASGPSFALSERAAWYACLDTYAQVQMMSNKEPSALVAEGIAACAKERRTFQFAYQRKMGRPERTTSANNAGGALLTEDFLAGRHLLLFILRFRMVG